MRKVERDPAGSKPRNEQPWEPERLGKISSQFAQLPHLDTLSRPEKRVNQRPSGSSGACRSAYEVGTFAMASFRDLL
jgi:hypothetical protein